MGVAWHGYYLAWFEVGRTDLLRRQGVTYKELEADGLRLPVTRAQMTFLRPALYDDLLEIRTQVAEVRGARMRFDYEVHREGTAGPLATGTTEHAATDPQGRPRRLPEQLRRLLGVAEAKRVIGRERRIHSGASDSRSQARSRSDR
jgi:acyl-CoA thioester hydrolase